MRQRSFLEEHHDVSRRYFLDLGLRSATGGLFAGAVGGGNAARAADPDPQTSLASLVDKLEYLTHPEKFGTVERGNPLPYKLPPEELQAAGMTRKTWRLEVVADPESNSQVGQPLRRSDGTALDFDGLMAMAKRQMASDRLTSQASQAQYAVPVPVLYSRICKRTIHKKYIYII